MKGSQHLCVPEWVSIFCSLTSLNHDKGVRVRVDGVLLPPNVVCCVVDVKSFNRKNLVTNDADPVAIVICEAVVELRIGLLT